MEGKAKPLVPLSRKDEGLEDVLKELLRRTVDKKNEDEYKQFYGKSVGVITLGRHQWHNYHDSLEFSGILESETKYSIFLRDMKSKQVEDRGPHIKSTYCGISKSKLITIYLMEE